MSARVTRRTFLLAGLPVTAAILAACQSQAVPVATKPPEAAKPTEAAKPAAPD